MEIKLKITLTEPMLGTIPKNKEVYTSFVADKAVKAELVAEEVETVQEMEEKGWTGFHKDVNGLFVYDYLFKGFLKEAANVLKGIVNVKNGRSKIDSYVFVFPRKIYIESADGEKLQTPDGILERSLRANTMQGPRVTLAKSDQVNAGRVLHVALTILGHNEITEKYIKALLDYGALKGLGQFRNGSYGRFIYEIM